MSGLLNSASEIAELRRAKAELQEALAATRNSEEQYRTMLSAIPTLVWRTTAEGAAEFFSQRWLEYTGMSFEEAQGSGWTAAFHPDDLETLSARWMEIVASQKPGEVEARFRRHDGEYHWHLMRSVPLFDEHGRLVNWCGTNTDIDDFKRAESFLAGEKKLFEMSATGHSLQAILEAVCETAEELAEDSLAVIQLLDDEGKCLRLGAARSLPDFYRRTIDSELIGPCSGSSGTAAFRAERVLVSDIATDPLWTDLKDLALEHGLRACFSTPMMSPDGSVIGTFAIYSRQAREITSREIRIADQFTHLAAILIGRKRADDELRASEALLAEGQRISQTGTWVWQVSTGRIVWSEEHCRIFGFSGDLLNVTLALFLETVHPTDVARVQAVLDDAVRRACEFSIEYRINLSDGSMKHIHSRARPVIGERGQVEQFIGTAMDISYRYEAKIALENALAQAVASEDQLRTLIDNLPGLAWTAGPNGEAEFLSQGWLNYTGMTLEEARGPGWANVIHPDDVGLMVERWQRIIATKKAGEQEARLRRFDGTYRWFSFRGAPLLDQWGHIVKWYGVNIDVEDQKRSDEEMRRLVSLIENSTDCIGYAWSPQEIAYMNAAWRTLAGLDVDADLAQYQMADLLPASDYRRFLDEIMPILTRDGHWEGEQTLHNIKTKIATPVHQTIFFISESGPDRRIGIATICRDITERKRSEQELRRSEADLRKVQSELAHITRVTTMGELAASIAHEVNQPIAAVVINGNACLRWLARETTDSNNIAEARETIQRIIRDGTHAGDVIARIRALFKKSEGSKAPLDLNEVIREVIALARSEMDKRRAVLRLELTSDLPRALGDRVQLQQVMLNLMLNGVEAMSGIDDWPRELVIGTRNLSAGQVLVTVRDSGTGLESGNVEQLFSAFFTTKPGGLGMGLSISRSIVEDHSGRLWATANDGPGATFQFSLPAES
ncbi:PAS domain-containing protein [Variovorax sp. GT1P44]|uniref:PAS domain-containing protein n=1 Tax=Variovorax sp. GT1P44 TaxID=3443742 RepID=UPI003F451611